MEHFNSHNLLFALNLPNIYEPERDPSAGISVHDLGIKALAAVPPHQVYHGIAGMKKFKTALSAWLREIESEKRSVTVEDVHLFFAEFNQNTTMNH